MKKNRLSAFISALLILLVVSACTDGTDLNGQTNTSAAKTSTASYWWTKSESTHETIIESTVEETLTVASESGKYTKSAETSVKSNITSNAATGSTVKPTAKSTVKPTAKPTKATAKPTVKPKPKPTSNNISAQTVYITDTGAKYHRSGCRYLRKSKYAISRSSAISNGYTPCSVCKP